MLSQMKPLLLLHVVEYTAHTKSDLPQKITELYKHRTAFYNSMHLGHLYINLNILNSLEYWYCLIRF